MEKRIACITIIAAIASLTARAEEINLKALSLRAEQERIVKLGIAPTGPGNAADIYMPYLTGEAEITRDKYFFSKIYALDKQFADEAKDDLDKLMAASKIKHSKVWGVYWKPDLHEHIFDIDLPKYENLAGLCTLLLFRGEEKQRSGDTRGAIEQYSAAFRVGMHIMEGVPDWLGYHFGRAVKVAAAKRLAPAYKALGDDVAAGAWEEYLKSAENKEAVRRSLFNNGYPSLIYTWDRGKLENFVLNQDMPLAMRLNLLESEHYCLDNTLSIVRRVAFGEPGWVNDLEDEFARQGELNKMFVENLRAHQPEWSWLSRFPGINLSPKDRLSDLSRTFYALFFFDSSDDAPQVPWLYAPLLGLLVVLLYVRRYHPRLLRMMLVAVIFSIPVIADNAITFKMVVNWQVDQELHRYIMEDLMQPWPTDQEWEQYHMEHPGMFDGYTTNA